MSAVVFFCSAFPLLPSSASSINCLTAASSFLRSPDLRLRLAGCRRSSVPRRRPVLSTAAMSLEAGALLHDASVAGLTSVVDLMLLLLWGDMVKRGVFEQCRASFRAPLPFLSWPPPAARLLLSSIALSVLTSSSRMPPSELHPQASSKSKPKLPASLSPSFQQAHLPSSIALSVLASSSRASPSELCSQASSKPKLPASPRFHRRLRLPPTAKASTDG